MKGLGAFDLFLLTWCSVFVLLAAALRKTLPRQAWSPSIDIVIPYDAKTGDKIVRIDRPSNVKYGAHFLLKPSRPLPFLIDSYTGVMVITRPLQRYLTESQPLEADLEIRSSNGPTLPSKAKLKVYVGEKRSTKPKFAMRIFRVKIRENNKPGIFLLNLRVLRPPNPKSQKTEIFLTRPSDIVAVNSRSGRVTLLKSLDREVKHKYRFRVGLRYLNDPMLIDMAQLVIKLIDVNDSPPQFVVRAPIFSILENATVGTFVGRLTAVDHDSRANGYRTFFQLRRRHAGSSPFRVKTDGTIILKRRLDREQQSHYTFIAKVVDGGTPPLSATATVTVEVLDVNDSPPKFIRFPKLLITSCQSSAPTEMIGQVQAADPDEPPNDVVRYTMWEDSGVAGADRKPPPPSPHTFLIDPYTGNIMVSLDKKKPCVRRTHNLTVVAFDPSNRSFKATRILKVIVTKTDSHADVMRTMIFGTLKPVVPVETKDSRNFYFIFSVFLITSFIAKLLKLLTCVALT